MLQRHLLTADVVYNGMGTPRANGAVVVQTEGEAAQIIAVEDAETARQNFPDAREKHVGFAISPPLVNAHTHLDLSTMPFTPGSYDAFIAKVIAYSPERRVRGLEAAKAGLLELRSKGVTTVGDIVTSEAVMELLLQAPDLQGVAYWEVLGPNPEDADKIFHETVEKLRKFRTWERPSGVKLGLSPHTPHTVSAPLLQKLATLAKRSALPIQIHVAESASEIALHRDGTGPLMERMRSFLPHWQPSGLTPVQYLKNLGVLDAQPTLIHMVHVSGRGRARGAAFGLRGGALPTFERGARMRTLSLGTVHETRRRSGVRYGLQGVFTRFVSRTRGHGGAGAARRQGE